MKYKIDTEEQRKLQETHERVRASMTTQQRALSDEVERLVQREAEELDGKFQQELRLRTIVSNITGLPLNLVSIGVVEDFQKKAKAARPGVFAYGSSPNILYKTMFGSVDSVQSYIPTLERTVIDITNNSQFTALSFWGLIKLAFSRLFKSNK